MRKLYFSCFSNKATLKAISYLIQVVVFITQNYPPRLIQLDMSTVNVNYTTHLFSFWVFKSSSYGVIKSPHPFFKEILNHRSSEFCMQVNCWTSIIPISRGLRKPMKIYTQQDSLGVFQIDESTVWEYRSGCV